MCAERHDATPTTAPLRTTRVGELDTVLAGGEDRQGGGEGPLVVLLHGYGAPGDDLVDLGRVCDVPRSTRFAFPAAPLEVAPHARAWWRIDMVRFQDALGRGQLRELTREEPDGLADARAQVATLLGTLPPAPKTVLGGFSQGAMLTMDVALRTEAKLDALVLLSGSILAEESWLPRMGALGGVPVFQSHGDRDPLLPFGVAERLGRELAAAGAKIEFVPFRGGHEIPGLVLDRLSGFLAHVLA